MLNKPYRMHASRAKQLNMTRSTEIDKSDDMLNLNIIEKFRKIKKQKMVINNFHDRDTLSEM